MSILGRSIVYFNPALSKRCRSVTHSWQMKCSAGLREEGFGQYEGGGFNLLRSLPFTAATRAERKPIFTSP